MTVVDDDGSPLAVLMHPDRAEKLRAAGQQLSDLADQPDDGRMHPAVHGPYADPEQGGMLIDTDPIRELLAWELAMQEIGDPPSRRDNEAAWQAWRDRVKACSDEMLDDREDKVSLLGGAVRIALALTLMPDEHGVVPVRAWGRREAEAEQVAHWQLAYVTKARGLFVRAGSPNLFGETFTVVTGSGYALRGGFDSREIAAAYAEAIAAAVPDVDWRVWDTPATEMPPAVWKTLKAVNDAWSEFGRNDADQTDDEVEATGRVDEFAEWGRAGRVVKHAAPRRPLAPAAVYAARGAARVCSCAATLAVLWALTEGWTP